MKRKAAVAIWLVFIFTGIGCTFWYKEWVYSLPTSLPANYKSVGTGAYIDFRTTIHTDSTKPVFLHFFNPDCPCSKFNMAHFKSIVKLYNDNVNFAIVVLSSKHYGEKDIQEKFGITLPVFFDSSIAARCGVYSTPQAVIIDTAHQMFYRGNYNRTRYCTDKKTEYAKTALTALLHRNTIQFDQYALKAYGCQLPKCTN
ncbi:MAG: hypothetical protein ABIQ88_11310 [Chitinophagaceae bacterium]